MIIDINKQMNSVSVVLRERDYANVATPDFPTFQFEKFGVVLHWDGHGGLNGIEFHNVNVVTVQEAVPR